ncbi:MAG: hypothetical protein Kow0059_01610 [Candidatus Sumerlaeia bacterium]
MNRLDLSPANIDSRLLDVFDLEQMESLGFIPLSQEGATLHLAVADPADAALIRRIQTLVPDRPLSFHQALPEQIRNALSQIRRGRTQQPPVPAASVPSRPTPQAPGQAPPAATDHPAGESLAAPPRRRVTRERLTQLWNELIEHLMALEPEQTLWLYESGGVCRVMRRHNSHNTLLMTIPLATYHKLHERLEDETAVAGLWDDARWLLLDHPLGGKAAFKMWQIDCLEQHVSWLERMPTFSREHLLRDYPYAPALIEELRHLFGERRRLIIGGQDPLLAKMCLYTLLQPSLDESHFPPAFFIERDAQMYFPGVAQMSQYEWTFLRLLENFDGEHAPFVFFETDLTEILVDDDILSKFWSGRWENLIVFMPFETLADMREELNAHTEWRDGGFIALFLHPRYIKTI